MAPAPSGAGILTSRSRTHSRLTVPQVAKEESVAFAPRLSTAYAATRPAGKAPVARFFTTFLERAERSARERTARAAQPARARVFASPVCIKRHYL